MHIEEVISGSIIEPLKRPKWTVGQARTSLWGFRHIRSWLWKRRLRGDPPLPGTHSVNILTYLTNKLPLFSQAVGLKTGPYSEAHLWAVLSWIFPQMRSWKTFKLLSVPTGWPEQVPRVWRRFPPHLTLTNSTSLSGCYSPLYCIRIYPHEVLALSALLPLFLSLFLSAITVVLVEYVTAYEWFEDSQRELDIPSHFGRHTARSNPHSSFKPVKLCIWKENFSCSLFF